MPNDHTLVECLCCERLRNYGQVALEGLVPEEVGRDDETRT